MIQWEYQVLDVAVLDWSGTKREQQLNALGAEGWELVGYCQAQAILKRPKAEPVRGQVLLEKTGPRREAV